MTLFRLALPVIKRTPPPVWRPLVSGLSPLVALAPGPIHQWEANVAALTGRRAGWRGRSRALRSWGRNVFEAAQLQRWTPEDVEAAVVIDDAGRQRLMSAHANRTDGGGGLVLALPHMGSWDLAGAWACLNGLPVSTVAEEIAEFDFFVAVREALGMVVHSHRDPRAIAKLTQELQGGRVICLVADRVFGPGGVPVTWPGVHGPIAGHLSAGPAHLAWRTGATLLGVATHFEGRQLRLVISQPITTAATTADEARRDLSQGLVDFFADQITQHPHDWHMLQPVFEGVRP